jgi:membrane-associated protease RseP (regulator of RpoE activity)
MAKKAAATAAPTPAAPPDPTATATISKADAVRAALAEGKDSPEEGVEFIKTKYGIEMTKPTFSSYKAQDKARKAKAGNGKPAPAAPRPKPVAASSNGHAGNPAELAREVKALVEKFGAVAVKEMTDVFAE